MFDLEAYLARIAYTGPREPTLDVLHALSAGHAQAIPFENLDVLLGRGIDLAPDAVFDKLVRQRRGGYCFEQNGLFLEALTALGFRATPLSARVRIDRPRDFLPPRTHLFLRVDIAGQSWLADVGVGALSLAGAIRLDVEGEQTTPHEPRRIVREGGRWFHQARLGDTWSDVYEFTGEEIPPVDRELANWYTSAHPQSHFRNRLIVARAAAEGRRVTLQNDAFKIRERDGSAAVETIASPEDLLVVLREHFGLNFPPETRFWAATQPDRAG